MIWIIPIALTVVAVAIGLNALFASEAQISMQVGADLVWQLSLTQALLALLGLFLTLALVLSVLKALFRAPKIIEKRKQDRARAQLLDHLTLGFNALSAGQLEQAKLQAQLAEKGCKALSSDGKNTKSNEAQGLVWLLKAQIARLQGDDKLAEQYYVEILSDKNAKMIGLRGLIAQNIRLNKRDETIRLLALAQEIEPKALWVQQNLIALQAASKNWSALVLQLESQSKQAAKSEPAAALESNKHHRSAALTQQAKDLLLKAVPDEEHLNFRAAKIELDVEQKAHLQQALVFLSKARKACSEFLPAKYFMALTYFLLDRRIDAQKLLLKAYRQDGLALFAYPYLTLAQQQQGYDHATSVRVLYNANKTAALSLRLMGQAYLAKSAQEPAALEQARDYILKAHAIDKDRDSYLLLAELAKAENKTTDQVNSIYNRANAAARNDVWSCEQCQSDALNWSALCSHCESFDSLIWGGANSEQPLKLEERMLLALQHHS